VERRAERTGGGMKQLGLLVAERVVTAEPPKPPLEGSLESRISHGLIRGGKGDVQTRRVAAIGREQAERTVPAYTRCNAGGRHGGRISRWRRPPAAEQDVRG
jgi:hypothetical protein